MFNPRKDCLWMFVSEFVRLYDFDIKFILEVSNFIFENINFDFLNN